MARTSVRFLATLLVLIWGGQLALADDAKAKQEAGKTDPHAAPTKQADPHAAGKADAKAEHGHDDHAHAAHDDHGHGGHSPPKLHGKPPGIRFLGKEVPLEAKGAEFLSLEWPNFIWTLVVFLGMFFVMHLLVWKPALKLIHDREHMIEHAHHEAETVREEAKALLAEHQAFLNQASTGARDILEAARADINAQVAAMLAKATADADAARKSAETELATARDEAIVAVKSSATSLGDRMAKQVIGGNS